MAGQRGWDGGREDRERTTREEEEGGWEGVEEGKNGEEIGDVGGSLKCRTHPLRMHVALALSPRILRPPPYLWIQVSASFRSFGFEKIDQKVLIGYVSNTQ